MGLANHLLKAAYLFLQFGELVHLFEGPEFFQLYKCVRKLLMQVIDHLSFRLYVFGEELVLAFQLAQLFLLLADPLLP